MKKTARKRKSEKVSWKFAAVSMLLLVLFTFFVYYKTFTTLKLYIDDGDPYSYRAVIPPMFLITLAFFYRGELKVEKDSKKLLLALPFFAVAAVMLFEADSFPSYALDALSLPFFVAGSALILFSIYTFRRFLFPILYLFLLWSPLFQPVASMQKDITNLTSDVVSLPIRITSLPIEREGNMFLSGSKVSMEVVPECVPLSAMIALFCFLLPFAYVAVGDMKNRVAWLVTWVVGGWVLNSLRIVAVLLIWYYSGVSSALQVFHAFGGNIIFDIAIVLSLLSLGLFKLEFPL